MVKRRTLRVDCYPETDDLNFRHMMVEIYIYIIRPKFVAEEPVECGPRLMA